ncbi:MULTISPECIES: hypothetical protein [unclassified Coleofasciculus]|uniref:hypothetical protein n=1 Tax=unclassified Coleofasciculus TaxID=2692782 RepID=UPI00188273A3|nr:MULTISPECIES: hypothetical protein [unclassified Coleofasciculus]MBE9130097.1 hypothetical protein [Coleofasciculus sp. LEGE 07081]MBE9150675.1 hypothetical protein [Coleofasciculus sp. LEGE 07092]
MKTIFKLAYFFVTGLGLALVCSGILLMAKADIPTTEVNGAKVPNWEEITFDSLGAINSSGSYQADSSVVNQLGYDPSKIWTQGQKPGEFMSLGDFPSLNFGATTLHTLGELAGGIDPKGFSLDEFGLMAKQTLNSLVEAIPELADFPIAQVIPIQDLIGQQVGGFDTSKTLSKVLQSNPQLGELSFSSLDLTQYQVGDIPNLELTQLGALKDWQSEVLNEVPNLTQVPLSEFGVEANGATVGKVDVVFGAAESKLSKTISGSNVEGFGVPCDKGCAHIEVSGASGVLGREWVSGKYQEVKGGEGVLGQVNNGLEPTGRLLFGDAFKVVVWNLDEATASGDLALFFRICKRGIPDLGCTPYFIGGVPLMSFSENDPILLGTIDNSKSDTASTPTQVALSQVQQAGSELSQKAVQNSNTSVQPTGSKNNNSNQTGSSFTKSDPLGCKAFVNMNVLGKTLSSSDLQGLVDTALGQIDPTTGQTFMGDRLIERVAQMQFGGMGIPVDSEAMDVNGVSAHTYGATELAEYKQMLKGMGC